MDAESPRSRELGCWDGPAACSALVSLAGNLAPADDFEPGEDYYNFLMDIGYGKTVDNDTKWFWARTIKENYGGDEGKRRICMAAVNLASRDGLHERLPYIRCPVLWLQVSSVRRACPRLDSDGLQGTHDVVFSVRNAQEEIKLFTNSAQTKLVPLEGGVHFLSYTHQQRVHQELLDFIARWKRNERAVL